MIITTVRDRAQTKNYKTSSLVQQICRLYEETIQYNPRTFTTFESVLLLCVEIVEYMTDHFRDELINRSPVLNVKNFVTR